jgi:hypothetical protein
MTTVLSKKKIRPNHTTAKGPTYMVPAKLLFSHLYCSLMNPIIASICGIFVGVFAVFAASPSSNFDSGDPVKKLAMAAALGEEFVKKLLEPLELSMGAVMMCVHSMKTSVNSLCGQGWLRCGALLYT